MSIEDGLRTHLLDDAPVAALVVARIYPLKLPQNPTYPALTYEIVSDIPYRGLAGDADLEVIRVRIHAWAETFAGAIDLATKVRTATADFSGTMGSPAIKVTSAKFETWNDLYEDVPEVYRRISDFFITHA